MRILITGAAGQLGSYLMRSLADEGHRDPAAPGHDMDPQVTAWTQRWAGDLFGVTPTQVELTDGDAVERAFAQAAPDVVIHTAAIAAVGQVYQNPDLARAVNVDATARLAKLAKRHGAHFTLISTDMVFDGEAAPYAEAHPTNPQSIYGQTKVEAEQAAAAEMDALILRASLLFGPTLVGRPRFWDQLVEALERGESVKLFFDEWRTPLSLDDAADRIMQAACQHRLTGVYHLAGPERQSRLEMGLALASDLGVDPAPIRAVSRLDAPAAEPRPRDLSLDGRKLRTAFEQGPSGELH